jgi:hypothetical protein
VVVIRMSVGFTITYTITTEVVSSNHAHDEVYPIQHYVIKFVCDLQHICGFLRFPPPVKLTTTI